MQAALHINDCAIIKFKCIINKKMYSFGKQINFLELHYAKKYYSVTNFVNI